MSSKPKEAVVVIGCGRAGGTIAHMLESEGYRIDSLTTASAQNIALLKEEFPEASVLRYAAGENTFPMQLRDSLQRSPLLLCLASNDQVLRTAIEEISALRKNWDETSVFHLSGAMDEKILTSFAKRGAYCATLHPCFPIFKIQKSLPRKQGVCFSFAGDTRSEKFFAKLVQAWESEFVLLRGIDRPNYHAANVLAAGHIVSLLSAAQDILKDNNVEAKDTQKILKSLLLGISSNLEKIAADASLKSLITGPFVRNDKEVISRHQNALAKQGPEIEQIYSLIGKLSQKFSLKT